MSSGAAGDPAAEAGATQVAVLDPKVLGRLSRKGFGLGQLVSRVDATTTRELRKAPEFRSIFAVLVRDIQAVVREHPHAEVTSSNGYRLFDQRWFDSGEMSFALIGVFNRLDRRAFRAGSCGEIRFVYRLGYETEQGKQPMAGRLPMTVNVVFDVESEPDCRAFARAWRWPEKLGADALAAWLLDRGPLASRWRASYRLRAVETNLQTIRVQSSVQPTLAGHVEYGMRVFRSTRERSEFAPAAMDNMPDVDALSKDATLRAELLSYLRQPKTRAALEQGILQIPEQFLAKKATSVSPRGLARPANRPYSRLFAASDFRDLDLGSYRTIRSSAALLRRLDGMSCTGCHQSRSIAGFHHVGLDTPDSPVWSSLKSGVSSHLLADLERRRSYVAAVADDRVPDEHRPTAERQGVDRGYGAPCGLGDSGFSDWTCASGFRCTQLEDPEIGTCLDDSSVGAPCEYGTMKPAARPGRDSITNLQRHACAEPLECHANVSGFPLGSCAAPCSSGEASAVCGDFLDVDGFQACLRSGRPLNDCSAGFVFETGLRFCDAETPCRQDYVCARTRDEQTGACVPSYFVYPLRLDAYPLLRGIE